MNILISGSNGAIARDLINFLLLNSSYNIFGISRTDSSSPSSSKRSKRFKNTTLDLNSFKSIENFFKTTKIDMVIHTAAILPNSNNSEPELFSNNILSTFNLASAFSKIHSKKRFIYLSSLPISKYRHPELIDKKVYSDPKSIYHLSKYIGEMIVKYFCNVYKYHYSILRIGSPITSSLNETFIIKVIKKALKNEKIVIFNKGSRIQTYNHIFDVSKIIDEIIKKSSKSRTYYIPGLSISNLNLAKEIIRITKSKSALFFKSSRPNDDSDNFKVKNYFIKKDLRISKFMDLVEIVSSVIKWGVDENTCI